MSTFARYLKRQMLVTHVAGIPVRVDYRWFFVLALMSAVTASSINTLANDMSLSLLLGFAATFIFFVSIFLHEFAHALAARMEGLEVIEIVLHPFGGLARFRREPQTPRAEFRIAVAGPAASFILALLFVAIMAAVNAAGTDILAAVFFLLALSNFLLAVFNMFPGYPLDGGRVLRAYLWKNGKDLNEATILTGLCGEYIAGGLIVLGLVIVVGRGEFFTGSWAIIVGIFLFDAARSIIREVRSTQHVAVEDLMKLPVPVSPDSTIQSVIDDLLTLTRQHVFPVAQNKQLYGMLLLKDVKSIDRALWRKTFVRDVMRPIETGHFVEIGTPLADAKALSRTNEVGAVAVVDSSGKLVGFL
ncbi:MAG TPA: site-2 protease family protein [Pyrinomonadaceae bacterium]|nr:site-2 protease family protein [Pyrinomonadaceae bacterium]